jgi:ATP dependent DNA ligase domain
LRKPPYPQDAIRLPPAGTLFLMHVAFVSRRPADLPELCQPTITVKPPAGPGWLHELKYDGFRLLARRDAAGTRLFTHRGNDWTERYPLVATAIGALKARSCAIDGEIAICDSNGLPVFDLLRHGPRVKREAVLFAFDLLELDGKDLTRDPIDSRSRQSPRPSLLLKSAKSPRRRSPSGIRTVIKQGRAAQEAKLGARQLALRTRKFRSDRHRSISRRSRAAASQRPRRPWRSGTMKLQPGAQFEISVDGHASRCQGNGDRGSRTLKRRSPQYASGEGR